MPKPTQDQLEKINRHTLTPLTEENCYVFPNMMIDNLPTSYYSIIQEGLLRKFNADVKRGVGLLLSHNSSKLPVGRSFDSSLVEEYDEERGEYIKSLYGDFYIALGRNTESGMTTDDIVSGIDSGTISDTSIGFSATAWECSICGNDIRSWSCPHYPGKKYVVEATEEGKEDTVETCYVLVGKDGVGELLENSLVYAGACDRASIINTYSKASVKEVDTQSKLHLVENIKNVPLDATIYQYYARDGVVLFTDTNERTEGTEILKKRGGENMDLTKLQEEFNFTNGDELKALLDAGKDLEGQLTQKEEELTNLNTELTETKTRVEELDLEILSLTTDLETERELNKNLKEENELLLENKVLAEEYRKGMTDEILTLGVRVQGNLFNKELYNKFLDTLSMAELREIKEDFSKGVTAKFEGTKISSTKVKEKGKDSELFKDDFEDEVEFREYIADKAMEYSKEEGVSITEATKLMYEKYNERGE